MAYPESISFPSRVAALGRALLLSMRPKQWAKNLVIYLAFFFTVGQTWGPGDLVFAFWLFREVTIAFLAFSALTGAVYLMNDSLDAPRDRLHPQKRLRPIASGQLPVQAAWAIAGALVVGGLMAAFALNVAFGAVSAVYVASMAAYSLLLKHLVLVDVLTISAGFVLRAVAGAVVIGVPISPWLYICTGLGALFLALAKRRSELETAGDGAAGQRAALEHYSAGLLDQLLTIVATSVVLAYSLYTFTAPNLPQNHAMMLTVPFVVYGLFRYMYLVHTRNVGESTEEIFSDRPLAAAIVLWLACAAAILAVFRS